MTKSRPSLGVIGGLVLILLGVALLLGGNSHVLGVWNNDKVAQPVINRATDGCVAAWLRTRDVAHEVSHGRGMTNTAIPKEIAVTAKAVRPFDGLLANDITYVGKSTTPREWHDRMVGLLRDCSDRRWMPPTQDLPLLQRLA